MTRIIQHNENITLEHIENRVNELMELIPHLEHGIRERAARLEEVRAETLHLEQQLSEQRAALERVRNEYSSLTRPSSVLN